MTTRHFDWLVAIVTAGFTPGFLIGWWTSRCENRKSMARRPGRFTQEGVSP
jgi:hypothetical protein